MPWVPFLLSNGLKRRSRRNNSSMPLVWYRYCVSCNLRLLAQARQAPRRSRWSRPVYLRMPRYSPMSRLSRSARTQICLSPILAPGIGSQSTQCETACIMSLPNGASIICAVENSELCRSPCHTVNVRPCPKGRLLPFAALLSNQKQWSGSSHNIDRILVSRRHLSPTRHKDTTAAPNR